MKWAQPRLCHHGLMPMQGVKTTPVAGVPQLGKRVLGAAGNEAASWMPLATLDIATMAYTGPTVGYAQEWGIEMPLDAQHSLLTLPRLLRAVTRRAMGSDLGKGSADGFKGCEVAIGLTLLLAAKKLSALSTWRHVRTLLAGPLSPMLCNLSTGAAPP